MVKTEYVCDRCEAVQSTPEQFWTVGVSVVIYTSPAYAAHRKEKHWCLKCVEGMGLLPNRTKEVKLVTPEPTFEDLIRAIVQDELSAGFGR